IDGHAISREVLRKEQSERVDARFGDAIRKVARSIHFTAIDPRPRIAAVLADYRAEIDDAAVALLAHQRHRRSAEEKGSLEVDIEHALPLGLGDRFRCALRDDACD